MERLERTLNSMIFLLLLIWPTFLVGEVLYEQDFDSGTFLLGVGDPVWSFSAPSSSLVGNENLFEVVSGVSHSGQYSLRFNYSGRNGICNMCGSTQRNQAVGFTSVNEFIDNKGADLTSAPYLAETNRIIFNKTDNFSKWKILSVQNESSVSDKLVLQLLAPGIGGENNFDSGDEVLIFRQCGIDGKIGGDINRRSDCNVAINYMSGIGQSPGESIYRRMYVKIDGSTVLPYSQKLRYWKTDNGLIFLVARTTKSNGKTYFYIEKSVAGGPSNFIVALNDIQKDKWYYIEEEFKAETSDMANDGEYRLWISEDGSISLSPVIDISGLDLGVVKAASLWGNHQHFEDSLGFWYMDDFKISTTRNGPVGGSIRPKAMPLPLIK